MSNPELLHVLTKIGVDPLARENLLRKMKHNNIHLRGVKCHLANIIKQEMLSLGGDAAVARDTVSCRLEATDVVLMGTLKQLRRFVRRIKAQPFSLLKQLSDQLDPILLNYEAESLVLRTSQRDITFAKKTLIMGILNVTPDSFSDGGKYLQTDAAIEHALEMAAEGADIIDIGGESSRPGAQPVSTAEELRRIIPIIDGIRGKVNVPVSVDTTKAQVAQKAVEAGAEIINDISSMTSDPQMAAVVAETKAAVVFMHMKGVPETMQAAPVYHDLWGEITDYLAGRIHEALSFGIQKEKIIVDPGIGFGKTIDHNLDIIRYLTELKIWGRPVLVGVSRKSFIGGLTNTGPDERKEGAIAAMTAAIMNGAHMVRVHEVPQMKKAIAVADAIVYGRLTQ
jgi:dihydropteroate synthase